MKVAALVLSLVISALAHSQVGKFPISLRETYELAKGQGDDTAIETALQAKPFAVIRLIDGYLEEWLAKVDEPVQDAQVAAQAGILIENAQDVAARASKLFESDAYSTYVRAWTAWTKLQRDQYRIGRGRFQEASKALVEKRYDDASDVYSDLLRVGAELGDLVGEARAHHSLGGLDLRAEDIQSAIDHFRHAKRIFASVHEQGGVGSVRALANAFEKDGQFAAARIELETVITMITENGSPREAVGPEVMRDLARVCIASGDTEAASRYEAEASALERGRSKNDR